MDLKTVKFVLTTTFLVIVAALIIASFTNNQLLIYIMLAFFGVYALVYLVGWRCPECRKHLGKLIARRCRHCGHRLDI